MTLATEKRKGKPIEIYDNRCTGCLICQLRCSLRFEKAFNPGRAKIKVHRLAGADTEYALSFEDDCDGCGICARSCPYEALIQKKAETVPE